MVLIWCLVGEGVFEESLLVELATVVIKRGTDLVELRGYKSLLSREPFDGGSYLILLITESVLLADGHVESSLLHLVSNDCVDFEESILIVTEGLLLLGLASDLSHVITVENLALYASEVQSSQELNQPKLIGSALFEMVDESQEGVLGVIGATIHPYSLREQPNLLLNSSLDVG